MRHSVHCYAAIFHICIVKMLGTELIPVSWQSAYSDISYKPSDRLSLLSTRFMVTFPAKVITPLGRYQIILLGDRGTQVQVACPRPLRNGAQAGLEPATCELQVRCPANSETASRK